MEPKMSKQGKTR